MSHHNSASLPNPTLVRSQGINEGQSLLTFNPMGPAINHGATGHSGLTWTVCERTHACHCPESFIQWVFGLLYYQPPNKGKPRATLLKADGRVTPLSADLGRDRHHPLTRAGNANICLHSSGLNFMVILSGYELPPNVKKKNKKQNKKESPEK